MPTPQRRNRPVVALVGRTNVGKSSLWNRLTESGRALVSSEEHTTRDRNFSDVFWRGRVFTLVDTGGMDVETTIVGQGILEQAETAIRDADLVLFVVDGQSGVLAQDLAFADLVRNRKKPTLLLVNKVDKQRQHANAFDPDMYRLRLGEPFAISAHTSYGIGDLLDEIQNTLERNGTPSISAHEANPVRLSFIGRPNVGKSSLVNSIVGEKRVIVSPVAHTTREPQDTWITYKDRDIVLVDTAGMRKRSHIKDRVESAGVDRNLEALKSTDVAFLVFDATEDPSAQDRHLAGLLEDQHAGIVLVANKWDLIQDKQTDSTIRHEELIRQLFPFLSWAPMVFVSARQNQRTTALLDYALRVQDERYRTIDYNALNKFLKTCIKQKRPIALYGPHSPRIYDAAQIGQAPPTFLITIVGEKETVHESWLRFFQKRLREKFGFEGTPIVVKARNLPPAKSSRAKRVSGPGMEAVAGPIIEKKRLVNQTRRRQKGR